MSLQGSEFMVGVLGPVQNQHKGIDGPVSPGWCFLVMSLVQDPEKHNVSQHSPKQKHMYCLYKSVGNDDVSLKCKRR